MNNDLVATNLRQSSLTQFLFTQGCTRERMVIFILLLMVIPIFLTITPVFAGLQQVFVDGQAGRFQQAHSELQGLSDDLEAQVTTADITIVGRNCAAIGFYSMLAQVSSDCILNKLAPNHGKKLFAAAQNAALGQLDKAASLAKDVTDSNPTYPQAQLLIARIRMASCMQHNQHCNEAIKIYQKALGMDKALAVAYLDLGMLYQHMEKNQEAIPVWETATNQAQGHAATKFAHLMLALLYSTEEQWTKAKRHAEKARDLKFTGFAAEVLDEIQRHIGSDSNADGQELSMKRKGDGNVTKLVVKENPEPDFMTGLGHGLTSPLRFFGLLDLHYVKKENRTDSYTLGLVIGCLIILSIGVGIFKGKK